MSIDIKNLDRGELFVYNNIDLADLFETVGGDAYQQAKIYGGAF